MTYDLDLDCGICTVRSWRRYDRVSLSKHADNPEVARHLRDRFPQPYRLRDADEWIDFCRSCAPQTDFAIVVDGEAVGGIGLIPQDDIARISAEIGYWLGEPVWGRGIATAAVTAFANWAFEAFELRRLYACVLENNPASCRVLEKCGFEREGRLRSSALKDDQVLDQFLYAKLRA
ncbi:MAG: GNAT family N-acetyltransferase [Acidobacteriota bacterium]